MIEKREKDAKYYITKQEPHTEPPQTMAVTINKESSTTEPPTLNTQ